MVKRGLCEPGAGIRNAYFPETMLMLRIISLKINQSFSEPGLPFAAYSIPKRVRSNRYGGRSPVPAFSEGHNPCLKAQWLFFIFYFHYSAHIIELFSFGLHFGYPEAGRRKALDFKKTIRIFCGSQVFFWLPSLRPFLKKLANNAIRRDATSISYPLLITTLPVRPFTKVSTCSVLIINDK
jgi:hypothetical protein